MVTDGLGTGSHGSRCLANIQMEPTRSTVSCHRVGVARGSFEKLARQQSLGRCNVQACRSSRGSSESSSGCSSKLAERHRAHFHAYYQDEAAVFAVDTIECLGGSLPNAQRRLAEAWAEIHRAELQHDWDLLQSGQPPIKQDRTTQVNHDASDPTGPMRSAARSGEG